MLYLSPSTSGYRINEWKFWKNQGWFVIISKLISAIKTFSNFPFFSFFCVYTGLQSTLKMCGIVTLTWSTYIFASFQNRLTIPEKSPKKWMLRYHNFERAKVKKVILIIIKSISLDIKLVQSPFSQQCFIKFS